MSRQILITDFFCEMQFSGGLMLLNQAIESHSNLSFGRANFLQTLRENYQPDEAP